VFPVQRREAIGGKPDRADLENADEGHRNADADQRASRGRHLPRRREREGDGADARDQRAEGQDPARTERVGQDAHRNLQQRVDEEISGGHRAQRGRVDRKGVGQFAGDRRGRSPVEEGEDVARQHNHEHDAPCLQKTLVLPFAHPPF
jgi:hypothetical protein